MADSIDWSVFEREFGSLYVENVGRPGLPIRRMVALHTTSTRLTHREMKGITSISAILSYNNDKLQ